MEENIQAVLDHLIQRYPVLKAQEEQILQAYDLMKDAYTRGCKVMTCGNGGSAADSEHIVGELMKGFVKCRPLDDNMRRSLRSVDEEMGKVLAKDLQGALPTVSLVGHPGLSTAYLNDVNPVLGFAQQVYGLGKEGDVLFAITTSGNSNNVLYAAVVAKAKGMNVIALTGKDGGKVKNLADVSIIVNEMETYKIQELHLPVYHALCLMLEETFFA